MAEATLRGTQEVLGLKNRPTPPSDYYRNCTKCGNSFHWSKMSKNHTGKYGVGCRCVNCNLDYNRKYKKDNKIRLISYRKEKTNKRIQQVNHANSRATKLGIPGRITSVEWNNLLKEYGGKCAYCGLSSANLHLDHIWPMSSYKNGCTFATNYIENIVPACSFCNLAKSDKPLIVFLTWLNNIRKG